jgi:hypothetical protein
MPHYKDLSGKLHFLESASFANLLPAGCVPITEEEAAVIENPPPTIEQKIAANTAAIQTELDREAQAYGYDNIFTAITYAGNEELTDPLRAKFQTEGNAFKAKRSAVWAQAYAHLALVEAGTAEMPTPEQAVAMMPALVLP